ncbi:MAG: hypothetical protein ACFFAE_11855 [Candidatus Hodarchaeota archaeon]
MIRTLNRKILLVLLIPLLGLSILNTSPIMGINPEYEVNPDFYTINIDPGESRTYVFDRIRMQQDDGFEERKLYINVTISGEVVETTVAEGSKVTVEFISENDTYIKTKHIWQLINGSEFVSDILLTNKSRLGVKKDNGDPRMIFTTNDSLIRDVYDTGDPSWWDIYFEGDRVRIRNDSSDSSINYEEEYEYNLTTGFLMQFRMRFESEGHQSEVEFRETRVWNPDWFELGVNVGDTNTYILNTMKWYDHYDGTYHHDTHVLVVVNDNPQYIPLHEKDEIIAKVTDIAGDFIELELTYKQLKEGKAVIDQQPYLIDKSTFWAPRDLGPPLLLTTNKTTWEQAPPGDVDLGDDVVKFHDSHTSPDGYWHDEMEGAWNLTTGWLQRFYNIQVEDPEGDMIIQREMEIINADYLPSEPKPEEPAEFVGVVDGDSITYEFKEIRGPENDLLNMTFPVDNKEQQILIQDGDTMTVKVKEVQGSFVTLVATVDSAEDGEVVTDPMMFDLKNLGFDKGPSFLLPTDEQMIDDLFKDKTGVELVYDDGDSVTIKFSRTEGDRDYNEEITYDLDTGWLIEYNRTVSEDGDIVEKVYAIATDSEESSDGDKTGNGPEITPLPVFPIICALFLIGGLVRKRRK